MYCNFGVKETDSKYFNIHIFGCHTRLCVLISVVVGFAEAKMAPAVADLKAMTDAFEGIDKLAEGAPRTDGAPNFRRVKKNTCLNERVRQCPMLRGVEI